jgi:hypothetical protein
MLSFTVLRCPQCAGIAQLPTPTSGNTMGLVAWSDGHVEGPMWRDQPRLCRCPHCGRVFLRRTATELESLSAAEGARAPARTEAPAVEQPTEDELLDFAESGLSPDDERLVRLAAWREGNHAFRREGAQWVSLSRRPRALRNLQLLLDKLTDSLHDRLVRAEGLREQGHFSDALASLARLDSSAARRIAQLAVEGVEQPSIMAIGA